MCQNRTALVRIAGRLAPQMVTILSRVVVSDATVFRELDGEAVLLNLDTGTYFGLNDVATRMWRLMEQLGRLDAVRDAIVGEFDVATVIAERDLVALVVALQEKGLVQVA
jgi:Coenzyme PQQ synthesis protein D (PqqD)